jgi:hypothetical protein
MDTDFDNEIKELDSDLNRLSNAAIIEREIFLKDCTETFKSYMIPCQKNGNTFTDSLISLSSSFEKLDFSSNLNFNISLGNEGIIEYTQIYLNSNKRDNDSCKELTLVFDNAKNIIKQNVEENKLYSCNFNVLKFFSINETLHSQLLFKLLNPNSEHGQGKLFLKEFLRLLDVAEPDNGVWKITAETGKIDLLLRRDHPCSIIIIENKSNGAVDQPNQLYRYWYQEIYLTTKEVDPAYYEKKINNFKIIYLPPTFFKYPEDHSISKPQDEAWLKLAKLPDKIPLKYEIRTYNEFIIQWITECIKILPESNHRMIEYLNQYIDICYNL